MDDPSVNDAESTAQTARWWESFFDDLYAGIELNSDDTERIESAVTFLIERLQVQAGDTVFDQCCGVGRLSIPLAQRGLRVIGVDLIDSYVSRATRRAADDADPAIADRCAFHCADAW